jgi:hypothetical protein
LLEAFFLQVNVLEEIFEVIFEEMFFYLVIYSETSQEDFYYQATFS